MRATLDDAPFRLPTSLAESELVAKYFRALGHPVRLGILDELRRRGECSVGELVELVGLAQPKVSQHLACLRWCGFVTTRREHRVVHYRLADDRVARMIALAHELLRGNAEHLAACEQIDAGC